MARTPFNVTTEDTPSINGQFSVNVGRTSFPHPGAEGPQHYIVNGRRIATSNPSWNGTTVQWTVEIDGTAYTFTGTRGTGNTFSGSVTWPSPEEDEDNWTAGAGEPEEVEERSATA